jgi:hypothetical protein
MQRVRSIPALPFFLAWSLIAMINGGGVMIGVYLHVHANARMHTTYPNLTGAWEGDQPGLLIPRMLRIASLPLIFQN